MQVIIDEIRNLAKLIWQDTEPDVVARRLPGENPAYPPFVASLLIDGRVKRTANGRSEDDAVATLRSILEEDYEFYRRSVHLRLLADTIRNHNLTLVETAEINRAKLWPEILGQNHPPTFDEKLVAAAFFEANGGSVLKV